MHSIRDILREKGATVRSIDPEITVFDALKLMADYGIGALLVTQNGKPVGLFSERDYARKLALRGLRSRETPVSAVMSAPVLTISPDASVQEGMQVMTAKFVRHLPVVDGSGVIGMVSIGDLVKAVIQDQQALIEQLEVTSRTERRQVRWTRLADALPGIARERTEALEHPCPVGRPPREDLEGRGGLPYRHPGAVEHAASLRRRGRRSAVSSGKYTMSATQWRGSSSTARDSGPGRFRHPERRRVHDAVGRRARSRRDRPRRGTAIARPRKRAAETRSVSATARLPGRRRTSVNRLVPSSSSANAVADPPPPAPIWTTAYRDERAGSPTRTASAKPVTSVLKPIRSPPRNRTVFTAPMLLRFPRQARQQRDHRLLERIGDVHACEPARDELGQHTRQGRRPRSRAPRNRLARSAARSSCARASCSCNHGERDARISRPTSPTRTEPGRSRAAPDEPNRDARHGERHAKRARTAPTAACRSRVARPRPPAR